MTELLFFLGRFHVLALHLPIGMLLLTITIDLLSRSERRHYLVQALPLCWAATAVTAVLTVILGLMHFAEGGFDGPSATAHRNYGISVAVVSVIVWLMAAKLPAFYRQARLFANALLLFLITMTGHYGGNLTHGSTYLVEYAPQPLRAMAGLAPRRAAVTDVGEADPWHDVVSPILASRCLSCHNPDKQRGQLDLSSLDSLLVGGESGAVVLPGNAQGSDLYRRVTLPHDHDDFMPAEGKTPLTGEQVRLLGWWIDAGMPVDTTVASVGVDDAVVGLLAIELGLAAPAATAMTAVMAQYPAVGETVIATMTDLGWLVRPLSANSNGLIVSIYSPGQAVSREMLQALAGAADAVVDLNMASAGLHDDLLAALTAMPGLQVLNLSNNGIGDSSLETVAGLDSLRVLNLYGNPAVTDAGLATLSKLENLEDLYVWGTGTSTAGIARLQAVLPELSVIGSVRSATVTTEPN